MPLISNPKDLRRIAEEMNSLEPENESNEKISDTPQDKLVDKEMYT